MIDGIECNREVEQHFYHPLLSGCRLLFLEHFLYSELSCVLTGISLSNVSLDDVLRARLFADLLQIRDLVIILEIIGI